MAQSDDPDVSAIYALHKRWLADVLGTGDSLFTPGSAIWTADHLDELERDFTGQPDLTKGKRFLEKLHDQLANVSSEAVQLMAEVHAVHFLVIWTGAISAAKKRSDLEAILAWMPVPCAVPDDVLEAMAPGLVHPGQWVMTRRDTQLTWLIRFSRAWKELPADEQRELAGNPWALKAFAGKVQSPGPVRLAEGPHFPGGLVPQRLHDRLTSLLGHRDERGDVVGGIGRGNSARPPPIARPRINNRVAGGPARPDQPDLPGQPGRPHVGPHGVERPLQPRDALWRLLENPGSYP